ncbi:unnamed protein product, partial [Rotaria socialis]
DYYEFTSKFIWQYLTDEDKQRLGPIVYWMSLSKEEQYQNAQELTKEEYKSQSVLELFTWRKLTAEEQQNFLKKSVEYNDKTENVLKNALQNAEAESALQGVMRLDVEIKRAIKFLQISTDLRQHQKRANNDTKQAGEQKKIVKRKQFVTRTIGQRIICRENEEYWVPGLVLNLPAHCTLPSDIYLIEVYDLNTKQVHVHRKDMIRITLALFQRSVLYLQNMKFPMNQTVVVMEPEVTPTNVQPSLSKADVHAIVQEIIDPLAQKVEHLNKSHHKRYIKLLTGIVVESNPPNYTIERFDFPGVRSIIPRHDIFLHSDRCLLKNTDVKSYILVKYPNDSRQFWCPAVVLRHMANESKTQVRFYDCLVLDITHETYVMPITEQQFEIYSTLRIAKEKSLINHVVVGLNNLKKTFMLGTIQSRVGNGHQYLIEWCCATVSEQSDEHLFGAFTRRNNHRIGDYVLAMDSVESIYRLAEILSITDDRKTVKVRFIDPNNINDTLSSKEVDVPTTTTFAITKTYFNKVIGLLQT